MNANTSRSLCCQMAMMMADMIAECWIIEIYTDKDFLQWMHDINLEITNMFTFYNRSVRTNLRSLPDFKLQSERRVNIDRLSLNTDTVMEGQFFLCRVLAPAYRMEGFMTIVDDPEGEKAVQLSIYDYETDLSNILPVGTVLAIKHPWFKKTLDGGYTVRVDHPINIVVMSEELLCTVFPIRIQWTGNIPKKYRNLNNQTVKKGKTVDDWKRMGNKCFSRKKYKDSLQAYAEGLKLEPNNSDILANRATSFINLGYFHRGLEDVNKVLEINPNHIKGVFRKAKALCGLKRYIEGLEFLQHKMSVNSEMTKDREFQDLLEKLKLLENQQNTGNYNFSELFLKTQQHQDDIADFVGPIRVAEIPGKGRGLIVTENIEPGCLLIVSKALAIAYKSANVTKAGDPELNMKLTYLQLGVKLVHMITEKIEMEPELNEEIFKLYAGPESEYPSNQKVIDKIHKIVSYNAFQCTVNAFENPNDKLNNNIIAKGVWILPSFINHSCWDCNSSWSTFGDVMIVRSIESIAKGEEILISYICPSAQYKKRESFCSNYNFTCFCRLCKLDREDSAEIHQERKSILEKIEKNSENESSLHEFLLKLRDMRLSDPMMNPSIIQPTRSLALIYFKKGRFQESVDVLIQVHEMMKNTAMIVDAARFAVNIVSSFIEAGKRKQIKKWIRILKEDLMVASGSLELMKIIGPDTLSRIKQRRIQFFA